MPTSYTSVVHVRVKVRLSDEALAFVRTQASAANISASDYLCRLMEREMQRDQSAKAEEKTREDRLTETTVFTWSEIPAKNRKRRDK